jgi:SAM-dependent methyltransferase
VSHREQIGFFTLVAQANAALIDGAEILEVGSYDVNGSIRALFSKAESYTGVDLCPGPGVDLVSLGHELDLPAAQYDGTISGECFEHDQYWALTFQNMIRMTRPGGLVVFSCASVGRPEHGTVRTRAQESPGTQSQGMDYYRNLTQSDFEREVELNREFVSWRFWYLQSSFDLYFAGVRSGEVPAGRPSAAIPNAAEVLAISSLTPVSERIVRLPLIPLSKVLPEQRYQTVILPYWNTMQRARRGLGPVRKSVSNSFRKSRTRS